MSKTDNFDALLEKSDDPLEIMNAMKKRFNIPSVEQKKKTVSRRKYHENVETQTQLSNEQLTNEFVSNWIFNESPDITDPPPNLEICDSFDYYVQDDPKLGRGVDDGSFPDDPVLRVLRRKLCRLENQQNQ